MAIESLDFLGIEGEIADAQARQDVSDLKSAAQTLDRRLNREAFTFDYDYTIGDKVEENSSASSASQRLGAEQALTAIKVSMTNPPTSVDMRLKISGGLDRAVNTSGVSAWETGITPVNGHTYRINTKFISGDLSVPDGSNPPSSTVVTAGTSTRISAVSVFSGYDAETTFTSDGSQVNLVMFFPRNVSVENGVYQVTMTDVTAQEEAFESAVLSCLPDTQYPENTAWE